MNDHDLLIQMNQKLSDLCTHFSNHIRHHWMVTVPLLAIVAGLVITLLIK